MASKKQSPTQPTAMAFDDPRRPLKVSRLRQARTAIGEFLQRAPTLDDDPDFEEWENSVSILLTELFGTSGYLLRFRQLTIRPISYSMGGGRRWHADPNESWATGLKQADKILGEAIEEAEITDLPVALNRSRTPANASRAQHNKVFVVHGHDDATREAVARFVEKLGIEAIVLNEQATGGRTIMEKLEFYSDVDFAVILLTPDDEGGAVGSAAQPRARQNVILERGYFVGKLGRKHVCALYKGSLELPSDFLGVGYVPLDSNGGWHVTLARELRAAGFSIDMNQVL